jgi:putative Mn2+ efflux pump MntP
MSPIAIAVLAFSMAMDAFVACLSRGASRRSPRLLHAAGTGALFGAIEAIMPVIGWLAGIAASSFIQTVDHWIAFILLAIVGGHMIVNAIRDHARNEAGQHALPHKRSRLMLAMTAVGTSIDAMIVGVSLAFLDVNILVVAAAIGCATFVMATTGILIGNKVGAGFGRWAEGLGGLLLIALGSAILYQHLLT